jgi:hypothetical protein
MAMISRRQTLEILCSRPVYEPLASQILRIFSVDYAKCPLTRKISSVIHGTERSWFVFVYPYGREYSSPTRPQRSL